MSELVLTIDGVEPLDFLGENNSKLNFIKSKYPELQIISRGNSLKITGDKKQTQELKAKVEVLVRYLKEHKELPMSAMDTIMAGMNPFDNKSIETPSSNGNIILHNKDGFPIRARTVNQKKLVDASERADIVFAVGPAGTGKTYTAVALAVKALKNRLVKKIILTRPAVEAGENLGFLPGDLKEKIDPYLRPLDDALDDMIPADKLAKFMTDRTIEVAPLAYMRGRTLDNAFIILDEAQNTTSPQIKMFLTRLGPSAKIIVTGDLTQIDLPYSQQSGLKRALALLTGIEGIAQVFLNEEDVVRHRLVRDIIKAYNASDEEIRVRKDKEREEREQQKLAAQDAIRKIEPN
ncbi:MAG: PhoH family protein [Saprospiraceae bacterium]|nr:PhoH family protein [Candidatus Brachybacter algidus]